MTDASPHGKSQNTLASDSASRETPIVEDTLDVRHFNNKTAKLKESTDPAHVGDSPMPLNTADSPEVGARSFLMKYAATWVAALMLFVQAALIAGSIPRNAVTVDEASHLPVGLRYWDTGEFWAYHHNPPLTRLYYAWPLVLQNSMRRHADYSFHLNDRWPDSAIARSFQSLYGREYLKPFIVARRAGIILAVLGGWLVFSFSRELFGAAGGLTSLSLWTFSPWVLAHGGLVTPDVGVTVLMLAATYMFWRYLQAPTCQEAALCGVLLGLATAAKFTAVFLVPIWGVLVLVWLPSSTVRSDGRRIIVHAGTLTLVSLLVLNSIYLWEGTGKRLGEFPLRSPTLTRIAAADGENERPERVNRFQDTWAGRLVVPLPEHYVLGFDDQLWDLEARGFSKYLGGELRAPHEDGWWYYYLYGLGVKTPLGTLAVIGFSLLLLSQGRYRRGLVTELVLLLPALGVLLSLSLKTNLNAHVRYVLPALPFLYVFAGRAGAWAVHFRWREVAVCCVVLLGTALSVLSVHPHYLAYFNEGAGGPRGGVHHLVDSNLDWGQGLLALADWLQDDAPDAPLYFAYFGAMDPANAGIEYEGLNPRNPKPGLHAVSATRLVGVEYFPGEPTRELQQPMKDSFRAYRDLNPIATPGYSIYVYRITPEDIEQMRLIDPIPL